MLYTVTLVLTSMYSVLCQTPIQYALEEESTSSLPLGNIIQDGGLRLPQDNSIFFTILPTDLELHRLFQVDRNGDFEPSGPVNRDQFCARLPVCEVKLDIQVNPEDFFQIVKVVVVVTDINDEVPSFGENVYSIQVSEAVRAGSAISLPRAIDLDSPINGLISYRVADLDTDMFELSSGSSDEPVLLIKDMLDREDTPSYQFILLAADSQAPDNSASATVLIDVLDINDNFPQFTKDLYEVNIRENVKANESLVQLSASDSDSGENARVFYYLSSATMETYGAVFTVDEESGDVKTNGELDYETIKEALLTVIARNKEATSPSSEAKVSIRVIDVNDESPSIKINKEPPGAVFKLAENASLSTFVAHVTVSDPDTGEGGLFTCSLNNQNFDLVKLYDTDFKIVTNQLFDREKVSEYVIHLTCTDQGNPVLASTHELTIELTDINDNPPVCTSSSFNAEVVEMERSEEVLLTVAATDEDLNDNGRLSFDIAAGPSSVTAQKHLRVNPHTGDITIIEPLDYEQIKVLSFNITVSDHGDPPWTSDCLVIVKVTDIDDEYPLFNEVVYEMKIAEDNPMGASVGEVRAKDSDSDAYNSFVYSFVENTDEGINSNLMSLADGSFILDSNTGIITVNTSLDRETRANYTLNLMAIGQGPNKLTSYCSVHILVTDVNDNSPVILFPISDNDTVLVTRIVYINTLITTVIARDNDLNENSRLNYHIVSGDEAGIFTIDSSTGEIMCSKYYTAPANHAVQLLIHVTDSGHPQLSNSTFLHIDFSLDADPQPLVEADTSAKNANIVIAIAVLSGVLMVVLATAIYCLLKQKRRNKPKHTEIQTISQEISTVYTAAPPRLEVQQQAPGKKGLAAEFDEVTFQQPDSKQHADHAALQQPAPPVSEEDPPSLQKSVGDCNGSEASDSGHGSNEESSSLPGTTTMLRRWENRLLTAAVTRQESNRLQSSQSFRSDSTTPPALPPRKRRTSQSFQFRFPQDPYLSAPTTDFLPESGSLYHGHGDPYRTEYTPSGMEPLDYMYDHPRYPSSEPPPPYHSNTLLYPPPPVFQFPEDDFHKEEFVDFINIPGYNSYSDDIQEQQQHYNEQRIYAPDEVFADDLRTFGASADVSLQERSALEKNSKYCSQV